MYNRDVSISCVVFRDKVRIAGGFYEEITRKFHKKKELKKNVSPPMLMN